MTEMAKDIRSGSDKTTNNPSLNVVWGGIFKRAFDIVASGLGLLVLSPFFLYIAMLIRRDSPGPVFYRGPRLGKDGVPFGILKFRTMHERPESYAGLHVTGKGDKRITPLGIWLRDTKVNELPQLWNVWVGEMSMVGPRPEDPSLAEAWSPDTRAEILSMRPGITSPASILYHNEENLLATGDVLTTYLQDIVPDKIRLDRLYVRNQSLLGDLDILFWTVVTLLPLMARQRIPEGDLFAGPLYRVMRRHVSWFFIDLGISLAAVAVAGVLWRLVEPIDWGIENLAVLAFALALLFSGINAFLGLNRIAWSQANAEDGLVLVAVNGATFLLLLFLNIMQEHSPWLSLPALAPELLVLIGVFTFFGFLAARYRLRLFTAFASRWLTWRQGDTGFGERVIVLGAGDGGQIAHWLLRRRDMRQAFTVVGMVDDSLAKQGMTVDGCRVLGSLGDLPDLMRKHDVGVVLFAIDSLPEAARGSLMHLCREAGVRVVFLSDILGTVQSHLAAAMP